MSKYQWSSDMNSGHNTGKSPDGQSSLSRSLSNHARSVRDSETRPCTSCSVVKPGEAFHKGKSRCRVCRGEDYQQAKRGLKREHEYWVLEGSKIVYRVRSRDTALYIMHQLCECGEYVSPDESNENLYCTNGVSLVEVRLGTSNTVVVAKIKDYVLTIN